MGAVVGWFVETEYYLKPVCVAPRVLQGRKWRVEAEVL